MFNHYIRLLFIVIFTSNELNITLGVKRVSSQEWSHTRYGGGYGYGGMGLGSDTTEWSLDSLGMQGIQGMQSPGNIEVVSTGGSGDSGLTSSVETSVQSIDVGKDNLVFVNDKGSIKMLRASQLPTVNKQSLASDALTTPAPNTVIQIPLDQYLARDSNNNPTKNPIQYMTARQPVGLPLTFASSRTPDNPCQVFANSGGGGGTDSQPIYIPAQSTSIPTGLDSRSDQKTVKIIIEMPESIAKDIDEASRYAATQVKRLRQQQLNGRTGSTDDRVEQTVIKSADGFKPKRKIKKNIHEIIRKVVELEEDNTESDEDIREGSGDGGDETGGQVDVDSSVDDMAEGANQKHENKLKVVSKVVKSGPKLATTKQKKYIVVQRKGRRPRRKGSRRRNPNQLKSVDKYKKVIRVYKT